MSFNLVVLEGVLAAEPEHRTVGDESSLLRCLLTVRSEAPHRIDVIPVTMWNPPNEVLSDVRTRGQPVWMAGRVERRFSAGPGGRQSRIEIVARAIERKEGPGDSDVARVDHR